MDLGGRELYYHAQNANISNVKAALAAGGRQYVNSYDVLGFTALMYAAKSGNVQITKLLLENGAHPDMVDAKGRSALLWALVHEHVSAACTLLSKGASPLIADHDGKNAVHYAVGIKSTSCLADIVRLCTADVINIPDNDGRTPLMWAAYYAQQDHIKLLLKRKSSSADPMMRDKEGRTALQWCAHNDFNIKCAKVLVTSRAELVSVTDYQSRSPLHYACMQGNLKLIAYLINLDSNVEAGDEKGYTALHWCTVVGKVAGIRLLIDHGVSVKCCDRNFVQPIHYAAQLGHLDCIRTLIRHGADINAKDDTGKSPIMWAATQGTYGAVALLLELKADINHQDDCKRTALHSAAYGGSLDCVKVLVTEGAELEAVDSQGHTAIFHSVVMLHIQCLRILLELGANSDCVDDQGRTPLHWAVSSGFDEAVHDLLQSNVSIDVGDHRGIRPIHEAAFFGTVGALSLILDYGGNVNIVDNDGLTPLHWACSGNQLACVKHLVACGAHLDLFDNSTEGRAPLDYALINGFSDLVVYLQQLGAHSRASMEQRASTTIQMGWKAYKHRKQLDKEQRILIRRSNSAVKIQALFRGHLGRMLYRMIRQEKWLKEQEEIAAELKREQERQEAAIRAKRAALAKRRKEMRENEKQLLARFKQDRRLTFDQWVSSKADDASRKNQRKLKEWEQLRPKRHFQNTCEDIRSTKRLSEYENWLMKKEDEHQDKLAELHDNLLMAVPKYKRMPREWEASLGAYSGKIMGRVFPGFGGGEPVSSEVEFEARTNRDIERLICKRGKKGPPLRLKRLAALPSILQKKHKSFGSLSALHASHARLSMMNSSNQLHSRISCRRPTLLHDFDHMTISKVDSKSRGNLSQRFGSSIYSESYDGADDAVERTLAIVTDVKVKKEVVITAIEAPDPSLYVWNLQTSIVE